MSETLKFNPSTGIIKVPTKNGVVEGSSHNSAIYVHPYAIRGADHIFVTTEEFEDSTQGVYIFRIASDLLMEGFDELVEEMVKCDYQMVVCDEVSDYDQEQFLGVMSEFAGRIATNDLERPWEVSND